MFTRLSNFTYGNYQIANIADLAVNSDIQLLIQIQKYEKECLEMLLGKLLYDDFISNLELDDKGFWKVKSSVDPKWSLLLNGDTNWKGLVVKVAKFEDDYIYETLMALYVFFKISLNNRTINTGTGEAKLKATNTTQESSNYKRIDAWNEFVQWACFGFGKNNLSLNQFLSLNKSSFPEALDISLQTLTYYDI